MIRQRIPRANSENAMRRQTAHGGGLRQALLRGLGKAAGCLRDKERPGRSLSASPGITEMKSSQVTKQVESSENRELSV